MTNPDPRILQIAIRRQSIAHENDNRAPRWDQLPAEERERLLAESAAWLRAAVEVHVAPLAERPTDKHDAVWVDDEGFLWSEYQTSPPTPLSEAAILRLVWDREECSSKSELEEQGVQFRLIGWSL